MIITKKIVLALLILSMAVIYWLWPKPEPLYPVAGSQIIIFGDSLAYGKGASSGHDLANLISADLNRDVINLGLNGDTTKTALARIGQVLSNDPQIVIILLGGNDALKKEPIADTFHNLSLIVEQIQAAGAGVVLVGEPGGLYGNQYEKEYERVAKEYRTFYVSNILSGLIGHSEYMSDYIHPNDAGYQKAAAMILPEVKKALRGE